MPQAEDDTLADIVVVAFRSARHQARLTAALQAQTEPRWRLIVIDNASPLAERIDGAALPAGATLVQSEINHGFAGGNNRAAALGRAPFIAFLNPDAFPEPDWLAQLLAAAARHPGAAAFGSTQIAADDDARYDGLGDVLHATGIMYRAGYGRMRRAPPPAEGETFCACAAAMLVRRAAFEAVGGFDEAFFCFCEDVDLGFRLRLAGWAVVQAPAAVVRHVGGASTGRRSAFAEWHGARNRLWTFVKNMPPPLFWPLLPAHALATLLVLASHLVTGRGLASWRGALAGVRGLPQAWRARRAIQARRKASAAAIARVLAWSPIALLDRRPVVRRPTRP